MKIITLKITLVLIFLVGSTALGQEGRLKRADKKFNQYAFVDAREIYLEIAEEGHSSAELFEKLGDSYYFNAQYEDAERWYQKLVTNYESEIRPEYLFRYAQTLRALKNYDAADRMMMKFNAVKGDDLRAELFEEEPNYIRNIGYQKSNYTLEDIRAINSRYSDFAPTEYEGKLIFASSRDTGGASKRIHKWNNQPFLDLYSTRVNEESYSQPSQFSKELNSKFHESTTTFTSDSKTVYFTRNNYNEGNYRKAESGTNKLKIYKSTRKGSKWGTPVEMPFNSDEYSTAHPTLSVDNKQLYFASDMPGTIGQSDIWVVDINKDGSYGEPRNLGRPINTEGRETFPFKSFNNDLYFASDGHPGLGGLDVYVLGQKEDGSADIINLGEPVNSSYDDFSFTVNDSTQVGYVASNRKRGMGSDDIYRFVQEVIPPCEPLIVGLVTDVDSGELLSGATVLLMDENNVLVKKIIVGDDAAFSFEADCEKSYVLRGSKEKYNPTERGVTTPNKSGKMSVGLTLEKTVKEAQVGDDLFQSLGLNPIYFDFDRFNIRPDAAFEISKVLVYMTEYPTSKIDIRSHTDSRGNDAYNESLSDKRARSTMEWLISKGVDRSRLTAKGFGENELVNECSNGVKCTEEAHQLNRRSEFIVVSQ